MVFRLPLLFILIYILLMYFRVTINASLVSCENGQLINMSVVTFGFLKKDYSCSLKEMLPGPGLISRLSELPNQMTIKLHNFKNNMLMASRILNWLVIERLEWKTRIGSEDAMDTAIMTGFLWSFKGSLISTVSSRARLRRLVVNIEPDFNKPGINTCLVCILKMRIVHIIIIASLIFVFKVRGYLNGYSRRENHQPPD